MTFYDASANADQKIIAPPKRHFFEKKINPGNFCPKSSEIFKWPKNREDSSDLDDFLTELIAPTQTII